MLLGEERDSRNFAGECIFCWNERSIVELIDARTDMNKVSQTGSSEAAMTLHFGERRKHGSLSEVEVLRTRQRRGVQSCFISPVLISTWRLQSGMVGMSLEIDGNLRNIIRLLRRSYACTMNIFTLNTTMDKVVSQWTGLGTYLVHLFGTYYKFSTMIWISYTRSHLLLVCE